MSRNIYLKMKTLEEARKIVFENFPMSGVLETEEVQVHEAVGRVLSEGVFAKISSPNFHAAAMDGIAVKAERTFGAAEPNPKNLVIGKEAFFVNTGNVLPENTDSVIMIEHVYFPDEQHIEINAPAVPWQHVRKMGEDIVATELLFPQNHVVTPYCIGALLAAGIFSVSVKTKPKILIIPTGSELVDWRTLPLKNGGLNLKAGQSPETNSFVLGKLTESCGGKYLRHDIVPDDLDKLKKAVYDGASADFNMVLTVGGSSAGSEDYTRKIISEIGSVLIHGVTIMPGKPVIIGVVNNKPVFGIPGYPVSAIIAFEQFVRPLIYRTLGLPEPKRDTIQVEPTRKIASKLGLEEFVRVKLGRVGNRIIATPMPRGAGCITTLTEAHGIIRIPNNIEGLKENEPVTAELLRPLSAIENTIVVIGSHDNTLDVLEDQLKAYGDITLSSSHVGSMGGLIAIKRGLCHVAGSHLLDTKDGSYNISYIRRFLPDSRVKVINLVLREQGLIIPAGNPKKIKGIEDLSRKDITFINRQSGSGTRILLDYKLKQLNIDPKTICGYENDEFTHMSVAAAVLSGRADIGLGIYAAAKALNLEFIPIITEQYDLIIPEEYIESKNIRILLDTINSPAFKKRVIALGGYSTEKTGQRSWDGK